MTDSDSEYPSIRKALFGNDTVANIRCGIKYIIWQLTYILITIAGISFTLLLLTLDKLTNNALTKRYGNLKHLVSHKFEDTRIAKGFSVIVEVVMWLLVILMVIGSIIGLITIVMESPVGFFAIISGFVLMAIIFEVLPILLDAIQRSRIGTILSYTREKLGLAGDRAKETPGVRRIYGRCPVSMSISPKWYRRISKYFE